MEKSNADEDVLVKMAAAEPDALSLLYDIYYERIFRYCIHRLRNRQIAEGITSEVFLCVSGDIKKFHGTTRAQFSSWLYKIATSKIYQYLRDNTRRTKLPDSMSGTGISSQSRDADDNNLSWPTLHKGILKLSFNEQALITLRYFEGLDPVKIAEIIGGNSNTIRVQILKTLEKLRRLLTNSPEK